MWSSGEGKIGKALEAITTDSPEKRKKAIERVRTLLQEDVEMGKVAVDPLMLLIHDPDEGVWEEAFKCLAMIIDERAGFIKRHMQPLADHLAQGTAPSGRVLMVLKKVASSRPKILAGLENQIMSLVVSDDRAVAEGASKVLDAMGLDGQGFLKTMGKAETSIRVAEAAGADIIAARLEVDRAKAQFLEKGLVDFKISVKRAEDLAKKAIRVVPVWDLKMDGVRSIAMSPSGYVLAYNVGRKVTVMRVDKVVMWSMDVGEAVDVMSFTPTDDALIVGAGRDVYRLSAGHAKVVWKATRGGKVTALAVTRPGNVLVASDDNNLSELTALGQETMRQWTQKAVMDMATSFDGNFILVGYRDHTVYCHDHRFLQRWRYMGGLWSDLDMSEDGTVMLGATAGGEIVCFSKTGIPVWKHNMTSPVAFVALSQGGHFAFVATKGAVYAFDNVGKMLWTYVPTATITGLSVSGTGETIAVLTEAGLHMLENRMPLERFLGQIGGMLTMMDRHGIDTKDLKTLAEAGKSAFRENDFTEGARIVAGIRDHVRKAMRKKAVEMLNSSEDLIKRAQCAGADVTEPVRIREEAQGLFTHGDYEGTMAVSKKALDATEMSMHHKRSLDEAEAEHRRAQIKEAINQAITFIDEAHHQGVSVERSEELLQAMITANDEGEFDQAIVLRSEIEEELAKERRVLPGRTEANFAKSIGIISKDTVTKEEADGVRTMLSQASKYYEMTGNRNRAAECYEWVGNLENKMGNPNASRGAFQRAVNIYLRTGALEKIAALIMNQMKKLESNEELPLFEVEEMFLIYKDGRLIFHSTARMRAAMDDQILGSMITAVQSFVDESMMGGSGGGGVGAGLNELRWGKTRILIHRGQYVTLAMVVTGTEPKDIWERLKGTVSDTEKKYEKILTMWDGDMDKLWGVKKHMEEFMATL